MNQLKLPNSSAASSSEQEDQEFEQEENPFNLLPFEMQEQIVDWLDMGSKKSLRIVNDSLRRLVNGRLNIHAILADTSFETFKNFDPEQQIEKLTVMNFFKSMGSSQFAKNVKFLEFVSMVGIDTGGIDLCESTESCNGFERNIIWFHRSGNSEENIINLLRLHPNIERLRFGPMALEHFKISGAPKLLGMKFDNLSRLEISFAVEKSKTDRILIDPYQQFLENSFPSLTNFIYRNESNEKPIALLTSIYEFVARQSKTIQSLGILSHSAYCYDEVPGNMNKMNNAFRNLFDTLKLKE